MAVRVPLRSRREHHGDLHHGNRGRGPGTRVPGMSPRRWKKGATTQLRSRAAHQRNRPCSPPTSRCSAGKTRAAEASRRASEQGSPGGHAEIDRKVLALARLTAAHIDKDPSLIQVGLDNIERWSRRSGYLHQAHAEWKRLIETHPWERLRDILLEESDEGQRLRSSHPFKGIVTEEERASIYGEIRAPERAERGPGGHLHVEANERGRDFVAGDVHECSWS